MNESSESLSANLAGVSPGAGSPASGQSLALERRLVQEKAKSRTTAVLLAGIVHAILVGIALLIVFAEPGGQEPELIVYSAPVQELERVSKKDLAQASRRQKPSPPSARATKVITAPVPNAVSVPVIEQHVDDPTALMGVGLSEFGDGFGTGGSGAGMGGGNFFGVAAKGNEFVYVIDGSTSMRSRNKWETCKKELIRSVSRLNGRQRFYVYIFNRDTVRMFDSVKVPSRLEAATSTNKEKMEKWLNSYTLNSGTYPQSALVEAIEKLRPDVIYLLSDGQFAEQDGSESYILRNAKRSSRMPTINTIAFQTESGQEVLKRIAKATGGQFTYVGR